MNDLRLENEQCDSLLGLKKSANRLQTSKKYKDAIGWLLALVGCLHVYRTCAGPGERIGQTYPSA